MIFIDRMDITKRRARGRLDELVCLAVPIKQTASGTLGQMMIPG